VTISRRTMFAVGAGVAASAVTGEVASAQDAAVGPSDVALARSLGDFRSGFADVNGTRLHYVTGGRGEPLVLLPGWPQTWWEYRKVLPVLAAQYRVFAVDMRGMGGSDKPRDGFDKKTMARDIVELVRRLGYRSVNIAGHDIGSMVAYSFAVNHPDATRKVALMDVPHPSDFLFTQLPLLPRPGEFSPWWFSFNQVRELPEQVLAGRFRFLADWLFDHLAFHPEAIADRDRAIFARAYDFPDAIRAGNGWYQAFAQDAADQNTYGQVTAPMLGLTTEPTDGLLRGLWLSQGTDVRVIKVPDSGHFILEEQPGAAARLLTDFFG
jgi:pimeloyl-ACP methyl ester carboxylesterase